MSKCLKQLIEEQVRKSPDKEWDIKNIEEISDKYLTEFASYLYQKYRALLSEAQESFWNSESDYDAGKCDGYADIVTSLTRNLENFTKD